MHVFRLPSGDVRGWADGAVVRATGIPYAEAERFEAPRPAPDRDEPFDATGWSPACPQPGSPDLVKVIGDQTGGLDQNEHCQNLSVTLPADTIIRNPTDQPAKTTEPAEPAERMLLPVMVWIHGGSYVAGAGDAPIYDPAALVVEQHVIVVSVTYRLGIFGYLGGGGRPANLGLLDQLEALAWVQRNIEAFGGDARRVTLFGQSAGADAIAHLMATPDASRLFARAIIQSAPFGISRGRAKMSEAMAAAGAVITAETPVEEAVLLQTRVTQAATRFGLKAAMAFGTQYGFAPLPSEHRIEAVWDAVAPEIDILIGHTAEEIRLFVPVLPLTKRLSAVPFVGPAATSALSRLLTSIVYSRGARRFARRHRRAGGRATNYTITFRAPDSPFGSCHAIEIPLLFGKRETWEGVAVLRGAPWAAIEAQGKQLRALWAGFARGEQLPARGAIADTVRYTRA